MSWQTRYEISVDLFHPADTWNPNPRVHAFTTPKGLSQCSCEEIVLRQLHSGTWSEQFTQKILCLNASSLGEAFKLLRDDSDGTEVVVDHEHQKKMMFELKSLCDCHRRFPSNRTSAIANEWGLLDRGLIQEDNSTYRCSNLGPVSMGFDQVLRPTPTVLKLVSCKSSRQLQRKVNAKVEKVIKAKLTSKFEESDQPGYLCILQRDDEPDHVNISFCEKNPVLQNDTLQQCVKDVRLIAHTTHIPRASRAKQLVYAELLYFQRWQDCGRCGKQHVDWFEIDADIARKVVLRWCRWLASEPYERRNGELSLRWHEKLLGKKQDNAVTIVDRYLKRQLDSNATSILINPDGEPNKDELRRKKMRAVSLVLVQKEVSCWYTPPDDDSETDSDMTEA